MQKGPGWDLEAASFLIDGPSLMKVEGRVIRKEKDGVWVSSFFSGWCCSFMNWMMKSWSSRDCLRLANLIILERTGVRPSKFADRELAWDEEDRNWTVRRGTIGSTWPYESAALT